MTGAAGGKRLLFLSTVYPTPWQPHKGPANASLVAALRRLGCTVDVLAPVPWTARLRHPRSGEPDTAQFPTYWYLPGALRHRYHAMFWASIQHALRSIPVPDAVLGFWADPDGTAAVRFGRERRIPAGVIAAGSDILLLPADPRRGAVIADTLRHADHLFAVGSESVRRAVGFGVEPGRVSNFIQGVDLDRFHAGNRSEARQRLGIPSDGPLLLWIGNMVPVKAAERVILVARRLVGRFPDLQVAMVGHGPDAAALRRLAGESGALAARIHFPGPVPSANLPPWYHAADVMVLPSRSEGVPNVLLEALATGLPFVASRVGSVEDLLPSPPSRTVTEGSLDDLEAAVTAVLASGGPVVPRPFDLNDGARQILDHLHLHRA